MVDGCVAFFLQMVTDFKSSPVNYYYLFTLIAKLFLLPVFYYSIYKYSNCSMIKQFLYNLRHSVKTKIIVLIISTVYIPLLIGFVTNAGHCLYCLMNNYPIHYTVSTDTQIFFLCVCCFAYFSRCGLVYAYLIMYFYWFLIDIYINKKAASK